VDGSGGGAHFDTERCGLRTVDVDEVLGAGRDHHKAVEFGLERDVVTRARRSGPPSESAAWSTGTFMKTLMGCGVTDGG
jgi:hypothetical protein